MLLHSTHFGRLSLLKTPSSSHLRTERGLSGRQARVTQRQATNVPSPNQHFCCAIILPNQHFWPKTIPAWNSFSGLSVKLSSECLPPDNRLRHLQNKHIALCSLTTPYVIWGQSSTPHFTSNRENPSPQNNKTKSPASSSVGSTNIKTLRRWHLPSFPSRATRCKFFTIFIAAFSIIGFI